MNNIEVIKDLAIIIRQEFTEKFYGIRFLTSPEDSQQIGIMKWEKGHIIQRHTHCLQPSRIAMQTQEVIIVKTGKIKVDLYIHEELKKSVILNSGDIICLLGGGHGITMLAKSTLLEIKQGPYIGSKEKIRF